MTPFISGFPGPILFFTTNLLDVRLRGIDPDPSYNENGRKSVPSPTRRIPQLWNQRIATKPQYHRSMTWYTLIFQSYLPEVWWFGWYAFGAQSYLLIRCLEAWGYLHDLWKKLQGTTCSAPPPKLPVSWEVFRISHAKSDVYLQTKLIHVKLECFTHNGKRNGQFPPKKKIDRLGSMGTLPETNSKFAP